MDYVNFIYKLLTIAIPNKLLGMLAITFIILLVIFRDCKCICRVFNKLLMLYSIIFLLLHMV